MKPDLKYQMSRFVGQDVCERLIGSHGHAQPVEFSPRVVDRPKTAVAILVRKLNANQCASDPSGQRLAEPANRQVLPESLGLVEHLVGDPLIRGQDNEVVTERKPAAAGDLSRSENDKGNQQPRTKRSHWIALLACIRRPWHSKRNTARDYRWHVTGVIENAAFYASR